MATSFATTDHQIVAPTWLEYPGLATVGHGLEGAVHAAGAEDGAVEWSGRRSWRVVETRSIHCQRLHV